MNDPTPETAPRMHAAANESIEAMFKQGCAMEVELAEAVRKRDTLADAVSYALDAFIESRYGEREVNGNARTRLMDALNVVGWRPKKP